MADIKRVAVIGAGSSGLVALKCCLEDGLAAVCYDARDKVGGIWNYEEVSTPGMSSTYKGLVCNTTKHMFEFSDFPCPEEFPMYWTAPIAAQYFDMYAEEFKLKDYIHFKHSVLKVSPQDKGRWLVRVLDHKTEIESEELFDAVIVCTGCTSQTFTPKIPGQEEFQGIQIHSQQFKRPEAYEGKNVVVVGFGNSGCDIAAECSIYAKQVYFSTRRKGWLLPRILNGNCPADRFVYRRLRNFMTSSLPSWWTEANLRSLVKKHWNHEIIDLKPKHKLTSQVYCLNDNLPLKILSGQVKLVDSISRMTPTTIIVGEESMSKMNTTIMSAEKETIEADVIIYATGYRPNSPIIEDIMHVEDEIPRIYKLIFPIDYPTLAFVGFAYVDGPVTTIYELQARWISRVFSGKMALPSRKEMEEKNMKQFQRLQKKYGPDHHQTHFVTYREYLNDIADSLGVQPKMWTLLFRDPTLFWPCLMAPLYPQQFRIHGPNPWPKARETILRYAKKEVHN